jgi:hypothetical protein
VTQRPCAQRIGKRLSGTIIRGTLKTPNSQLVTPISIKLQRLDHASPEPSLGLGQPTSRDFRPARGPPFNGRHISGSPEALASLRSNPD